MARRVARIPELVAVVAVLSITVAMAFCASSVPRVPTSTDLLTKALKSYYDALADYDAYCRAKKPGPIARCQDLHDRLVSLLNAEHSAAEWNMQPPGSADTQLAQAFARMDAELDLTKQSVAALKAAR